MIYLLNKYFKVEVVDLHLYNVSKEALGLLDPETIKSKRILPVKKITSHLTVASSNPFQTELYSSLAKQCGLKILPGYCPKDQLEEYINSNFPS